MKRRQFLRMGGVGALSSMAGCSTVFGAVPKARSTAVLSLFKEPIIKAESSLSGVGPLYATVVTSQADADARMNWQAFKSGSYSEDYHPHLEDWQGIDYDQYFISVFLVQFSNLPTERDSLRPNEHFADETLIFTLDGHEWPLSRTTGAIWPRDEEANSPESDLFTHLVKWERNGATPTDAEVRLTYADN